MQNLGVHGAINPNLVFGENVLYISPPTLLFSVIGIIDTGPSPPIFGDRGTEYLGGYSGVLMYSIVPTKHPPMGIGEYRAAT